MLKNEIWRVDLAFVDKLAKEKNCVKFLLVRQILFDRLGVAKVMKTNDSKVNVRAFPAMIKTKNVPRRIKLTRDRVWWRGFFKKIMLQEDKLVLK